MVTRKTLKDLGLSFKRYKLMHPHTGEADSLRAIVLTEKNAEQLVFYIKGLGGQATLSSKSPGRIRIEQWNHGINWAKKDYRVALPGDYIVQFPDATWARVKKEDFFGKLVKEEK